jgi:hypothetical protein
MFIPRKGLMVIIFFYCNAFPMQMLCVLYAVFTGISRITDHKHHPTDVMAGAVLGAVMAVATVHRILVADTEGRQQSADSRGSRRGRGLYEVEGDQLIEEYIRNCHGDDSQGEKPAVLRPTSAV